MTTVVATTVRQPDSRIILLLKKWGPLLLILMLNALSSTYAITAVFTNIGTQICAAATGIATLALPLAIAAVALIGLAMIIDNYRPLGRIFPIMFGAGIAVGAPAIAALIATGTGAC
jgi:hypothetical protein